MEARELKKKFDKDNRVNQSTEERKKNFEEKPERNNLGKSTEEFRKLLKGNFESYKE